MPHKAVERTAVPSVVSYSEVIERWLQHASGVAKQHGIRPTLEPFEFAGELEDISKIRNTSSIETQQVHYAAIETVIRDIFYELLASHSIDDPSFNVIWNLLDIVIILSDKDCCESTLVIYLVEELLDSQTLQSCRRVFDYLESRREQITARHFKAKSLAILRACNELLRRLSRAEDTVFCGRVFIFLFQSFPLGDRSSVNLRGEYHVDNITAYDDLPSQPLVDGSMAMDVDVDETKDSHIEIQETTVENDTATMDDITQLDTKSIKSEPQNMSGTKITLDIEKLYPLFWSLQRYFSMPTNLFNQGNLKSFKDALEASLSKFKEVQSDAEPRGGTKHSDENRQGMKRKRAGTSDELAGSFNPKYLTSRDLFGLEISDLAFRRHVLVQALILIDFLLSLTPKAKAKVENMKNKSVLYEYTLDEDNTKWATHMRSEIATYLQQGPEGKFYYRMVDTVLLRDKNWVRWKAENCVPYQRPSITAIEFIEARDNAHKACSNKRLRATPLGSLDLSFLSDGESIDGLNKLKDPARFAIPTADTFRALIADDEFEAQTAKNNDEKQLAVNARASKLWRMLRIVQRTKFNLLDRIDDGNNIQILFEDVESEKHSQNVAGELVEQDQITFKSSEHISVTISEP